MLAKQQHWIPQFYLEYFAASRSGRGMAQVWMLSKHDDDPTEPRLVGVNGICKRKHLHSPKIKGEERRDAALDEKIGELESTMASIWQRLAQEDHVLGLPGLKKMIALFMAVLYLRHPENIAIQAELHRVWADQLDMGPKGEDQVPLLDTVTIGGITYKADTSDWHEWRNAGTDDHHRAFALSIEREARFLAEKFLTKRWRVLVADTPSFVTSDRCVAKHHLDRQIYGVGTPGVFILFPLSPTRLLVLDDPGPHAGEYFSTTAVAWLNGMIWRGAARYMISPRPIDDVLREILAAS